MAATLPNELNTLRELVSSLQTTLAAVQAENQLLRQKLDALARRLFGVSSEALNPAQLQLLLTLPELAPAATTAPLTESAPRPVAVRKDRAPRLPEALPVIEEVIDPEPVKAQPEQWRCIGQEISEQLDYEPGRFLRRRTIRRKYVHRTEVDAVPVIAPLPECLQERGIAAPGLL
jgi:hypothetical protein